jgi:hypothetical protein
MPMTPADFGRFIADEIEKWAKVVELAAGTIDRFEAVDVKMGAQLGREPLGTPIPSAVC